MVNVALVKTLVDGVVAPIGVLLIEAPVIALENVPEVMVPTVARLGALVSVPIVDVALMRVSARVLVK